MVLTGIGKKRCLGDSTASNNTAVGYEALYCKHYVAMYNTAALDMLAALDANLQETKTRCRSKVLLGTNTTGDGNTAIGHGALAVSTTADNNTQLGYASLGANTTGHNNVALGAYL